MPHFQEQPQNTFVIRFWWEWKGEGSDRSRGWCGHIEHIQSGEGIFFRDQHQLLAFIERFIAPMTTQSFGDER